MRSTVTTGLLLCVLLMLALSACAEAPTPPVSTPTSKPIETPSPAPPRPTQPPGPVVDDWARIQATKTMLVASSLDNPPFDMYDPQFKPSGFDIASMTELGKRLGVSARFKDFTFDGLLGALQINQADAVISSMRDHQGPPGAGRLHPGLLPRRRRHPGRAGLADHRGQDEGRCGEPARGGAARLGVRGVPVARTSWAPARCRAPTCNPTCSRATQ